METWELRNSILAAARRWPAFLAFVILGGLLGWLTSYLSPTPYRATAELFIGLNPYRVPDDRYVAAFGGVVYRNRDDYKNWQMEQLNGLAYFDEVLQAALTSLRSVDPYWEEVTLASIEERLDLFWQSAGIWHLVAVDPDPQRASELVEAWRDAVFEVSNGAIQSSQKLYSLDLQIQALEAEIVDANARQSELVDIRGALQSFRQHLGELPADDQLSLIDRWRLERLAGEAVGFDEDGLTIVGDIPADGAGVGAYLPWLDHLIESIDLELESLPSGLQALESRREQLLTQWDATLASGHGLAATLTVERPSGKAPEVEKVRQSGLVIAVGALIGALLWVILEFMRLNRGRAA
jgi:hypothetical protein